MDQESIPQMKQYSDNQNFHGMRPSIMESADESAYPLPESPGAPSRYYPPAEQEYPSEYQEAPAPAEYYPEEPQYYPEESQEQYAPAPESDYNYGQQKYQQNYYQPQPPAALDTDTITEIAEQVTEDKTSSIKKSMEKLNEFKILSETKINNIDLRLQSIENTLDKIQLAILEKVSSYAESIESMQKEMEMVQESFGKIVSSPEKIKEVRKSVKKAPGKKHKR
jgi:prefoldin subunit 5